MKLNNITYVFLALMLAVTSSNSQERGREDRERGSRDAQWAREAMERFRGSDRVNPLDPEAVKRRLDYAVKEGLMTREQADKMMVDAKKRMDAAQRGNNEGRGRETQSNDRQADARKGYEIRRKRIEEGVKSGEIKREDAAKMYAELRKRTEAANRGGGDKKEESKEDPRLERYRAAERHFAAEVKAGKLSKGDAQKKLIEIRKRLWGGGERDAQNRQSNGDNRKRTGDIVEVAAGNKSFRTLVAVVKAAGLADSLKSKRPLTVFAPTDEAFAKLPKGTLQSLLKPENKKKLISILSYHVVPGRVLAKNVKSGRVKTLNGSSFEIRVSKGEVTVNKARVVATDVMASNGVIHVVDAVIMPPSSSSSRDSQSSQSKKPQPKGRDHDHDKGERGKKDHEQDRAQHFRQAIGHLQAAGRHDLAKEIEERMHEARHNQDQHRQKHGDYKGHGNHGRRDRGDKMRKAWEERMKQWREARERDADRDGRRPETHRGPERGRWPQWRGSERMKQWREARERDVDRSGRRPETHREPERGRWPQGRGLERGGSRGR